MVLYCLCKSLPDVKHSVIRASTLLFPRCISNIPNKKEDSFAVSYLKNTLGFSQETAIRLTSSSSSSRQLQFENPEKPDLVLQFFQHYGFSKTQVSNVIRKFPLLLSSNIEKNLLPKFEFFLPKGITVPDLAELISTNPNILRHSLQNSTIPNYNFLKSLLGSDEKVYLVVKRSLRWNKDLKAYAEPNIAILREFGVPELNIKILVVRKPGVLLTSCDQLRESAHEVKRMGINPLKMAFVVAICAKSGLHKSTWEKKLNVYREWGWSDKEILLAFAKHPCCMTYSQDKIMATMDFFVNRMGWESSMISRSPALLSYSLIKRIIPRCSVLEVLLSKGLIKKNMGFTTLLKSTDKQFLERYVTCYEEEAPQLLKLYQEKLDLTAV